MALQRHVVTAPNLQKPVDTRCVTVAQQVFSLTSIEHWRWIGHASEQKALVFGQNGQSRTLESNLLIVNALQSYVSGFISLERGSDRSNSTGCDDDSNVLSGESSDVDMLEPHEDCQLKAMACFFRNTSSFCVRGA